MPKCIPCMSESLKETIHAFTDDPHTLQQVDALLTCPGGEIFEICGGKRGGGRKPGAYASFIGTCLKSKPIKGKPFGAAAQYMKECSLEWKRTHGGNSGR